jgi:hypothetical protein
MDGEIPHVTEIAKVFFPAAVAELLARAAAARGIPDASPAERVKPPERRLTPAVG